MAKAAHGFPAPSTAAWTLKDSWFSTITGLKKQLSVFKLGPLPPLESQREFKLGDKVEAFHKHSWWEGHVTKDLGKGRFVVSLSDSVEIPFPKELLRTHQEWINHNWVPSSRDRISELPDTVLLHIMNFMDTKQAVQTCVLSKRWKHLCKRLSNLRFITTLKVRNRIEYFEKFASWVLSSRDDSYSLLNLTICGSTEPELLDRVIKYALLRNVQELTMYIISRFRPYSESLQSICCCQSLTSLKLLIGFDIYKVVLPKSLHLPALKNLLLSNVLFTASDSNYAEPFSNCHMLKILVLMDCYNDAQVLRICNSSLSSLEILNGRTYQIALSTPYLSSFTIKGSARHQLFSTHNLSFLEEVCIDMRRWDEDWRGTKKSSIIIGWLQVFVNVKILTFSMHAFQVIIRDLSLTTRPQPPSFVRLESFKVKRDLSESVFDWEVKKGMAYLLQDSPLARSRVHLIRTASMISIRNSIDGVPM